MRHRCITAALLCAGWSAQAAPPAKNPDWPCQQIKVPAMSVGAVWSGPDIEGNRSTWATDREVADLVARLVQRRIPSEQAGAEIASFAKAAGEGRRDRLVALFAGLFQVLDQERTAVQDGLDRFGRRQRQLADQVRADAELLRAQQGAATPDAARVAQLAESLTWDTRVFEDRRQMLGAACDVPNIIEQRLFALSQAIQAALP